MYLLMVAGEEDRSSVVLSAQGAHPRNGGKELAQYLQLRVTFELRDTCLGIPREAAGK